MTNRYYLLTMPKTDKKRPEKIHLWVEWGYEVHSLKVEPGDWADITAGKKLSLPGKRYRYEGDAFDCTWYFNEREKGDLRVEYANVNGNWGGVGDGYGGTWQHAYLNGQK